MAASSGKPVGEESPDSTKRWCRVTPGRGNPRDSATENRPPRSNQRFASGETGATVKRWGKSPPRTWQQGRHGKPHQEQWRIGGPHGRASVRTPGCQLDLAGNGKVRGMVIASQDVQNPAYRPSASLSSFDVRRMAVSVSGGPSNSKTTVLDIVNAMMAEAHSGKRSPATSAMPTATPA